jgi:hypothetical protein
MSDTPRTNAGHWLYEDDNGEEFDVVDFCLALQLERELNASEARVKELERERDEARGGGVMAFEARRSRRSPAFRV